jgi:DNA-binding CsgD family transcriptional regulator
MRAGTVPRQHTIGPGCQFDSLAARPEAGTRDVQGEVLAGVQEMLEHAQSGEFDLMAVPEAGFAVIVARGNIRLTLVVEVSVPGRGLSPRELEIARLVARGATNQAIARALDISTWTVSTHLRRIFAKLSVGTRAEMVAELFGTPHLLSGG